MELVFIRHGQSEWNAKNLFTGWRDVKLSEQGLAAAAAAGKKLKEKGYEFDIAFTSVLTRAIKTCNIVLEESDQLFVPQIKSWRLNERHYGQLQGLDKKQTAEKYGDEQVHIWRRSYDTLPPLLEGIDGFEADFADDAVVRHACGALEHTGGIAVAVVDAGIKKLESDRFGHFVGLVTLPKRFTVNADSLLAGHGTHGAGKAVCHCSTLGDSPVCFAAGVFGMVDVTALVREDAVDELVEFDGHKKSL